MVKGMGVHVCETCGSTCETIGDYLDCLESHEREREVRHEHTWKRGSMTDLFGRVPVVCAGCLEMGQMSYEQARGHPAWTAVDYERDAERIERKFG